MKELKNFLMWSVFGVPLGMSIVLLGGVYSHKETNIVIMSVTCIIAAIFFVVAAINRDGLTVTPVAIPLIIIVAFASIQLIPLSIDTIRIISPKGAFFRGLGPFSKGPLTMSVPDTIYSILRVTTLILFSTVVSTVIHKKDRNWKKMIYGTIMFLSTWSIITAFVLRIIHADSWLYGNLYKHSFLMDPIIINPNHAAGFFGISAFIILASIYRSDILRIRFFYGALFFIHCIALVSTLSRAGIASFLSALILLSVMNKFSSGKFFKHRTVIFFIAFSLTTVIYSGHSFLSKEFDFYREGYFSKVSNITDVEPYLKDFAVTGSGLGSFSKVFTYYQSDPETRFTQLENEPLQFILETGFPFALMIFGILIWLFVKRSSVMKYQGEKTALFALLFFVVTHNLLDFNLHNFSTLFLVITVSAILLKPFPITVQHIRYVAVLSVSVALSAVLVSITDYGKILAENKEFISYERSLYHYPADYSIPFLESIRMMNSEDMAVLYSAGSYISDAIAKAPRYYYSYFVAGSYMLRIGAQKQAVVLYKKSTSLSGKKLSSVLDRIYRQLQSREREYLFPEIIPYSIENREQIEIFLRKNSYDSTISKKIIEKRKDLFFIPAIRDMIRNDSLEKAIEMIKETKKSEIDLSSKEKGRLLMFEGDVARKKQEYEEAFKLYLEGASETEEFNDYLAAAGVALLAGNEEISVIENKLKKQSFLSKRNMAGYHKWLSEKEFKQNSFSKGVEHLNKAVNLNPLPGWMFELYRHYSRNNMNFEAKSTLELLLKQHPDYRKDLVTKLLEEENRKMKDKKEKAYKEKILKK